MADTHTEVTFRDQAHIVHEFEAGYAPVEVQLIGARLADAYFMRLAEPQFVELAHGRGGDQWEPSGQVQRGYRRAHWWDDEENEYHGTAAEAMANGDPWVWEDCSEGDANAVPCTWIEVDLAQRVEAAGGPNA